MKKQYMDFVPTASPKKVQSKPKASKTAKIEKKTVAKTETKIKQPKNKVAFSGEKNEKLGVVENLNERFVKTSVAKRPLSEQKHFKAKPTEVAAIKAEKVGNKASKTVKTVKVEEPKAKTGYVPPKNPFINQKKVEKRPLSKNVYTRKIETPVEEPKGPVTIISKPEKQNHVGVIITVILTIILGAAAGTVAFLLLPK